MEQKDFAGKGGFIWWIGFVEDRKDPLKLGRCRVRCVGWHADNKMQLPTENLPWAMTAFPPNNTHPYAPKEGEMCFGFFSDGEAAQQPVLLGMFPSIPLKANNIQEAFSDPRKAEELATAPRPPQTRDYKTDGTGIVITEETQAKNNPINLDEPTTSRIARNDEDTITKTYIQTRKDSVVNEVETYNKEELLTSWNEPETKYAAKYPYNNVNETESGHLFEQDDTPGAERIHMAHRNGSFIEWYPDGDKVEKVTKNNYSIIMADDNLYVMGNVRVTVQGNAEVYVQKNVFLRVDENVTALVKGNVDFDIYGNATGLIKGNLNATVNKNATVKVDGNVGVTVGGNYNEQVGGTYTVNSGGAMKFTAPRIDLN
jgi:hypothetical protein